MTGIARLTPGYEMEKNLSSQREPQTLTTSGTVSPIRTTPTLTKRKPRNAAENRKWVNQLFLRMGAIYGRKFNSQYGKGLLVAKHEWGEAICALTAQEIRKALDVLRSPLSSFCEWPPTIGQFMGLALAEALPPKPGIAFDYASRRYFPHPIIFESFSKIGEWDFKHQPESVLRGRFKEYYMEAVKNFSDRQDYLSLGVDTL